MVTLFHISAPLIWIIGAWRIVYAIKHCHDPDFTIHLVVGFFLILMSVTFFFYNKHMWKFDVIPPAGY